MPISQIDRDMVRAAIAAEDSKFCSHNGFDVQAIENAMKRNASGGRIRGGSTISQQTAKNAFLWQSGGYARKGVEAWFTFLIEHLWGKRRIMEVYLNLDETGIGTYGVNAGSQRYFGHDASAMTATEAARHRGGPPVAQEARSRSARGIHSSLRQHHRGAHPDRRPRRARRLHLSGRERSGEQGAAARRQEGTADPGRGIRKHQTAAAARECRARGIAIGN